LISLTATCKFFSAIGLAFSFISNNKGLLSNLLISNLSKLFDIAPEIITMLVLFIIENSKSTIMNLCISFLNNIKIQY
ncbi:Uncharacterized protein FWK35_00032487, partial [Aphis craccivora]